MMELSDNAVKYLFKTAYLLFDLPYLFQEHPFD